MDKHHRMKQVGHVVVRFIKKCPIDARRAMLMLLNGEERFLFAVFRSYVISKPFGA